MNDCKSQSKQDSVVSSTVENFLLTRKYCAAKDLDLPNRSVMEMVIEKAIDSESGHTNVLAFSSTSKDTTSYFHELEQQFLSLKTFIAGTNQAYKHELLALKYPIFVNIYLELVEKGQDMKAVMFYNQHMADFLNEHKEELQHLRGITGPGKLSTSDTAAHFMKSKFVLKLSHKVFTYLLQFLSNENRALLLHFIDKKIHLDVNNTKLSLHEKYVDGNVDAGKKNESVEESKPENYIKEFQDSCNSLKNEAPCSPSIILHKVTNCQQGLTSAVISKDGELMCGGFEDSSVHLWSLTPKKLAVNKESFTELSQIKLGTELASMSEAPTSLMSSDSLVLRGHSGPVYSVCFSQDNSFVLSASEDLSVKLWGMNSYTNRVSYIGHNYPVYHVELSSLDVYFVSTSMDQTARLWNLEYNYPLRIFAGHTASVHTGKFHPNCSYIATASSDETCRLWDVHSGSFVRLLNGQKGSIFSLAFSPDGKCLLGSGEDTLIYIWDIGSGKLLQKLSSHSHTVYTLAVNSCNLLASGGSDGLINVWNINNALKTAETASNQTCTKPMQSYTTECMSIFYTDFKNDNLLYTVGH